MFLIFLSLFLESHSSAISNRRSSLEGPLTEISSNGLFGGYGYVVPVISAITNSPSNNYLPPATLEPPFFGPQSDDDTIVIPVKPPNISSDPPKTYLPPVTLEPPFFGPQNDEDTVVIPAFPNKATTSPKFRILSMSCLKDTFFRVNFLSNYPPVIEDPVLGSSNMPSCFRQLNPRSFEFDCFGLERMKICGVKFCNNGKMCLVIRLPVISGLRLAQDTNLVLECKPLDRIGAKTKQLKYGVQAM